MRITITNLRKILLLVFLFLPLSCARRSPSEENRFRIQTRSIQETLDFYGTPQSAAAYFLHSPITALIESVSCEQGTRVEKGELLLTYHKAPSSEGPARQTWIQEIRSPVSGAVQSVHVKPGDIVFGEGELVSPSLLIVLGVEGPETVHIRLFPWEGSKLKEGMAATIRFPDTSEIEARVARVCLDANYAEIQPVGETSLSEKGTTKERCIVEIPLQPERPRLTIPIQALQRCEGRDLLTLCRSGEEVSIPVTVGATDSVWAEIEGEFMEGELVRRTP